MIPDQKYKVIIADCPWSYQQFSEAKNGAAASAYPTMTTEDIAAIPVEDWLDKNAVVFMWATWPKLLDAFEVGHCWGLEYVTAFPWIKTSPNTENIKLGIGFWTQGVSEIVTIWKRGKSKAKKSAANVAGLLTGEERQFYAPSGKHSKKPMDLHQYAENRLPGPYCELFARRQMPGWDCFGLDLGYLLSERGIERVPING